MPAAQAQASAPGGSEAASSSGRPYYSTQHTGHSGSFSSTGLSPRTRGRHSSQDASSVRTSASALDRQQPLHQQARYNSGESSPGFAPLDELYAQLDKVEKIREGAQSILQLIDQDGFSSSSNRLPSGGAAAALRSKVEAELYAAENRISVLQFQIQALSRLPMLHDNAPEAGYKDLQPPFFSPSQSPSTGPLSLLPVSPVSVPSGALQATSQTESIPDPLESEPNDSEPEDAHSTTAARNLVLSLLQSIQSLVEDGTSPFGGPSRSRPGAFTAPSFSQHGTGSRLKSPEDDSTLSRPTSSSILELLDRLFTVLRRSTRLRYEFLGPIPFKARLDSGYSSGQSSSSEADGATDQESALGAEPLVDTTIRLLADHMGQDIRVKTYRLLSHLLVPPSAAFLARCRSRGLELYLSRSLIRESKFDKERIEALRFIRRANELSEHTRAKQWPDGDLGGVESTKGRRRSTDDLEPDEPERWLQPEKEKGFDDDLPFRPALIRTIASGVGEEKDKLRWLFLETLAEIAIRHPHLIHRADAFSVLVQALRSGPPEYIPNLVQMMLFLLDMPCTRHYLRPGLDIEVALSTVTDVPFKKTAAYEAEVRDGVKAITVILRSWSGLLYMCMYQRKPIGSIVKALVAGTRESRDAIIGMLEELFQLAHVQSTATLSKMTSRSGPGLRHIDSKTLLNSGAMYATAPSREANSRSIGTSGGRQASASASRLKIVPGPARPNLLEQYASLLLAIFVEAGIIDALVHVVEESPGPFLDERYSATDEAPKPAHAMMLPTAEEADAIEQHKRLHIGRKAVRLLGAVMQLARRLLPLEEAVSVQSVPRLFALAAHFHGAGEQPIFRNGKAFSAQTQRNAEQSNAFRTQESGSLSASGRALASSALAVIDSMHRAPLSRASATQLKLDIRDARESSDTIMPGDVTALTSRPSLSSQDPSAFRVALLSNSIELSDSNAGLKSPDSPASTGPLSPTMDEAARRRNVELARVRAGMQMDDAHFRHLLLESGVLTHKEHTKWNLGAINELLEGPLMNARRLEEVSKGSKFVRRLLSFFHPSEQRFALIPNTAANRKYVRLGCTMIRAFLATAEGVKVLGEDPLLREIRHALEMLDPLSMGQSGGPMPTGDQWMSKIRVEETLTYGYFEMIGILSRNGEGLGLLHKVQMFTVLYHLSGVQSRDYLIGEVIKNFDYSVDGHTRIILSKVLTSTYRNMRIFATRTLTGLIAKSNEPGQWLIALLLTQLYDTASEVRELAVRAAMQACTSPAVLELVVSMRPTLEHLGEDSHPLLLRFMSSSNGFRFLQRGDYINREMEDWLGIRNLRYTIHLELLLARALSLDGPSKTPQQAQNSAGLETNVEAVPSSRFAPESLWADALEAFDGTVPAHFYGELVKTTEGCALLAKKGHFGEFASFVRRHGKESDDVEVLAKLKSVLWAVGHIGASPRGLSFLEAEDIISVIVEIAERSKVLSIRGVGFFVIGMISSTPHGAEILHDYGWRTAWTSTGLPTGVCIPDEIDRFVEIEPWVPMRGRTKAYSELMPSQDPVERDILDALSELGNRIVAKLAYKELFKLKLRFPRYFEEPASTSLNQLSTAPPAFANGRDADTTPTIGSIEDSKALKAKFELDSIPQKRLVLLVRTMELLDQFPLPLSMRRSIWELFDVKLDEVLIRTLAKTRQHLIEERRRWLSSEEATGGSETAGALSEEERIRLMTVNRPGPGTVAYAAKAGLIHGLVAGRHRPADYQAQRDGEYYKADKSKGSFVVPAAHAGPALPGQGEALVGTRRDRMRLVVDDNDDDDAEEDGDDSDDDSDPEDVSMLGLEHRSAAGPPHSLLSRAAGGPAVVVSGASYRPT